MTAADLTKRYADLQQVPRPRLFDLSPALALVYLLLQVYTQHAGRRPPAVTAIVVGLDEDGTPQVWFSHRTFW